MFPVVVIVGRPNVGKSTLFNCLTRTRQALVLDEPGVTRDRHYGQMQVGSQTCLLIDTGGLLGETPQNSMDEKIADQVEQAIGEADYILFVVDGRQALTAADSAIAQYLRKTNKPITVVVNKAEGQNADNVLAEFFALGWGTPLAISASHSQGIDTIKDVLSHALVKEDDTTEEVVSAEPEGVKIAIVGRPNVGKSTLVNRMLGEERVIVFDAPGTTRDSIFIPMQRFDKPYVLIDTAGVRRKRQLDTALEHYSVVKSMQAVKAADVVIFVIDGQEGVTDQDLHLLDFITETGRALVIAVNKWDNLPEYERDQVRQKLDRKLSFVDFAETYFISALHGSNVGLLFKAVDKAYQSAIQTLSTSALTDALQQAVFDHQPPMVKGRRIKLRYAHMGGHLPPTIVIHGNQVNSLPASYVRYLVHEFRKVFKLHGTPVKIVLKSNDNPFADRKGKPKFYEG